MKLMSLLNVIDNQETILVWDDNKPVDTPPLLKGKVEDCKCHRSIGNCIVKKIIPMEYCIDILIDVEYQKKKAQRKEVGAMPREKQIEEMARVMANGRFIEPDRNQILLFAGEAETLYNAGYRKQEWIGVDERLPEVIGSYLVFTYDRRMYICRFIDHYCDGNAQFDDYKVTHWMPLPETPKMKGGAE